MKKQVDVSHYEFKKYISKKRWSSMWHQIDEVLALKPESILELGPGPGVFKALCENFGMRVKTLDIDSHLKPDFIASVLDMPFEDDSYSVVCAFQMLEHLPYEDSMKAFSEIVRVAKKQVIISLPDANKVLRFCFDLPRIGEFNIHFPIIFYNNRKHIFDGEHYWEINKKGYSLSRVMGDIKALSELSGFSLQKSYRVPEFPYHRFFLISKNFSYSN